MITPDRIVFYFGKASVTFQRTEESMTYNITVVLANGAAVTFLARGRQVSPGWATSLLQREIDEHTTKPTTT